MSLEDDDDNCVSDDSFDYFDDYPEGYGSDEEGYGMEEDNQEEREKIITVGIARVPASLQESIADILHKRQGAYTRDWMRARLPRAWLIAIGHRVPASCRSPGHGSPSVAPLASPELWKLPGAVLQTHFASYWETVR
jgi:hypothetical protein